MKRVKRLISILISSAVALTSTASLASDAVAAPESIDINGYSCYERNGNYWTVLDGQEYLVIDLDYFVGNEPQMTFSESCSSSYSAQAATSPIGKPDGHRNTDWIDLTEKGGSYEDRCYLTYGDYYSPIYCFNNEINIHSSATAKISTKVVFTNTYYIDIFVHTGQNTGGWHLMGDNVRIDFNIFQPFRILFSGTANQLIDGFALVFSGDSPGQKELYYTVEVAVKNS